VNIIDPILIKRGDVHINEHGVVWVADSDARRDNLADGNGVTVFTRHFPAASEITGRHRTTYAKGELAVNIYRRVQA
jgi:hypothetical protein